MEQVGMSYFTMNENTVPKMQTRKSFICSWLKSDSNSITATKKLQQCGGSLVLYFSVKKSVSCFKPKLCRIEDLLGTSNEKNATLF